MNSTENLKRALWDSSEGFFVTALRNTLKLGNDVLYDWEDKIWIVQFWGDWKIFVDFLEQTLCKTILEFKWGKTSLEIFHYLS